MFYVYDSFSRKGLDTWLAGQTGTDHYPDWGKDAEVLEVGRNIRNKSHLFFSKAYLLRNADNCQLRFRIAYNIPFMHGNLFTDTSWVKLEDSYGNDYSGCLTAYPSKAAGLNCIDVTLVMDADTFSALPGGKLTVSAVCAEVGSDEEDSYASFDVELLIPAGNESKSWNFSSMGP